METPLPFGESPASAPFKALFMVMAIFFFAYLGSILLQQTGCTQTDNISISSETPKEIELKPITLTLSKKHYVPCENQSEEIYCFRHKLAPFYSTINKKAVKTHIESEETYYFVIK